MLSKPSNSRIIFLSLITLGTYFFYWCLKSAAAVNQSAGQRLTPNNVYLFLPGLTYWWMWNYTQALESSSYGRIKAIDIFLISIFAANLWSTIFFTLRNSNHYPFIIYIALFALSTISGSALFCIVAQHKINIALAAGNNAA